VFQNSQFGDNANWPALSMPTTLVSVRCTSVCFFLIVYMILASKNLHEGISAPYLGVYQ